MLMLLPLILLLLGIAGVVVGWRGRRVDDHPLCRGCRYDLSGSPELPQRCPECGRDLTSPRAMRRGNRRKRRVVLGAGATLLLIGLSGGGAMVWSAASDFNWYPYKPLWLLRRDAAGSDATRAIASQQEILDRLTTDRLSESQIKDIIDEAMAAHPDQKATWFAWWGDFIVDAWQKGHVERETLATYLRTGVEQSLTLRVRPKLRQNSQAMYWQIWAPTRLGSKSGPFGVFLSDRRHLLDGEQLRERGGLGMHGGLSSSGGGGSGSTFDVDAALGEHVLEMEVTLTIVPQDSILEQRDSSGRINLEERLAAARENAIAEWTQRLTAAFEVVPEDEPLVELLDDPDLADDIRQTIQIQRCAIMSVGSRPPRALFSLFGADPPVPVAFDVYWRIGEREWLVAAVASSTRSRAIRPVLSEGVRGMRLDGFPEDADSVDIILRSNPFLADRDLEVTHIWAGEIIFEDVPLDIH